MTRSSTTSSCTSTGGCARSRTSQIPRWAARARCQVPTGRGPHATWCWRCCRAVKMWGGQVAALLRPARGPRAWPRTALASRAEVDRVESAGPRNGRRDGCRATGTPPAVPGDRICSACRAPFPSATVARFHAASLGWGGGRGGPPRSGRGGATVRGDRDRAAPGPHRRRDPRTCFMRWTGGSTSRPGRPRSRCARLINVLPTGRNFYSVDPKAVPSRLLAYATGTAMADSLLERYRTDTGEWPRSVGLSVWGTSAMRTSGDDIGGGTGPARRAAGVGRGLPSGGRPRADVAPWPNWAARGSTSRSGYPGSSGDAFPHVVTMLDDAVRHGRRTGRGRRRMPTYVRDARRGRPGRARRPSAEPRSGLRLQTGRLRCGPAAADRAHASWRDGRGPGRGVRRVGGLRLRPRPRRA